MSAKRKSRRGVDDAEQVSKTSSGTLNTDQVRILRALVLGDTIPMMTIKERIQIGISSEDKYSGSFRKSLQDLLEDGLIVREKRERNAYWYTITQTGSRTLTDVEVAAGVAVTKTRLLNFDAMDEVIHVSSPPTGNNWDWTNRPATQASTAPTTTAEIDLIAHERANRSHRELERLIASLIRAAGRTPQQNVNIDIFDVDADGSLLAEIKSCREDNLHAQVRRGVSQLFEYRYVYADILGDAVALVLAIEIKPPRAKAWLVDYLQSLGITLIWKSADGKRFETSAHIPQRVAGIASATTL